MKMLLDSGGAVLCIHCAREAEHYGAWVVRFARDFGSSQGILEFYCAGDEQPGYVVGQRYTLTVCG